MGIVGIDWSRAFQRAQNAPWKRGRELKAEEQGEGGGKGQWAFGLFNVARTAMGWQTGGHVGCLTSQGRQWAGKQVGMWAV